MEPIRSAENARYRALARLAASARERRREGLTLLDGVHLVEAWMQRHGPPEQVVVSRAGRERPEVAALLRTVPVARVLDLADGLFRGLSTVETPTGILGVIRRPESGPPPPDGPVLYLEDVQDPGNLGSVLRSAAAAGLPRVLLSLDSADPWSPRALRAGMGAQFLVEVHERVDGPEWAGAYRGRIIATDHRTSRSLYSTDLRGDVALVFGNEGAGLSREMLEAAGEAIAIPMPGGMESLNLAAAAAICLFERVRQQAGGSITLPA